MESPTGCMGSKDDRYRTYSCQSETTCAGSRSSSLCSYEKDNGTNEDVASCQELPYEPVSEPPYHVFGSSMKRNCILMVSLAGSLSPLSSNIYFPATEAIAEHLRVDSSHIALTITIYMVVQGIAPSIWGPMSDTKGRKITFVSTLIIYLIANLCLAFVQKFEVLMLLRGIQAAGSAATIAIGSGVIADITTPRERGGWTGVFGGLRQTAQSLGPVFGGLITHYLGFHAIFWSLFVFGSFTLLLIATCLPETLRSIGGNGSVRLHGIHKPLVYHFKEQPDVTENQDLPSRQELKVRSFLEPFCLVWKKDIVTVLLFGAIQYTIHSIVNSSTTKLLKPKFKLSDVEVGLAFLPNGFGVILGAIITGRLMDYDYKYYEEKYRQEKGIGSETSLEKKKIPIDFPIEKARQRRLPWFALLLIVSTGLYGASFQWGHIAAPLFFQFLIAFSSTAVFTSNSTLIVDLYPGAAASATAINNFARCQIGSGGTASIVPIVEKFGETSAFLGAGGLLVLALPLLGLEWRYGGQWRKERIQKVQANQDEQKSEA